MLVMNMTLLRLTTDKLHKIIQISGMILIELVEVARCWEQQNLLVAKMQTCTMAGVTL